MSNLQVNPGTSDEAAGAWRSRAVPDSNGSVAQVVCWVLISTTPYHHARFTAFAGMTEVPPVLLELTNQDPFKCLEFSAPTSAYIRCSLGDLLNRKDLASPKLQKLLFHQLDQISPGAVCVSGWSLPGSLETLLWCARRRIRVIMFSESTSFDTPRVWWKEAVKIRLLSLASAVLVGGAPHADYARALRVPPERIFEGYDTVDNYHFESRSDAARQDAVALRLRFRLPERYFFSCCRFEPKKNLTGLLHAYAIYRAREGAAAWSLVIAGSGPQRTLLELLAATLNIEDNVIFLGARSYDEMPIFYGLASAFVHASTTEQWGLVVNEAASSRLPLVVSERCGCAQDLVKNGVTGLVFDPHDSSDIASKLCSISSDTVACDRMGDAARRVAREWSPGRFAANLTAAIRTAAANPVPRPTVVTVAILRGVLGLRWTAQVLFALLPRALRLRMGLGL